MVRQDSRAPSIEDVNDRAAVDEGNRQVDRHIPTRADRRAAEARGFDEGSEVTGMMVTVRVADSGLATRRSPLQRAAGGENFGPKCRFTTILSEF